MTPAPVVALLLGLIAAAQAEAGWNQWSTMGPGGSPIPVAIDPISPATVYTSARPFQAAVYKSTDGGAHWTASNIDPAVFVVTVVAVDPQTPTTVYAGTSGFDVWGVFKSVDGGIHWNPSNAGFPPPHLSSRFPLSTFPCSTVSPWTA